MTTINYRLSAMLIAASLALPAVQALAAAPKASPSAKKQGPNDKIQTREELRACMALKESNNARTIDLDKRNELNRKEKAELANAPDNAQAVRADVEAKLAALKAADAAVVANNKLIEDWNLRSEDFEKKIEGKRNVDRSRMLFKQERADLTAKDAALIADRTAKVAIYEKSVADANAKINERGSNNEAWNKKNELLVAEGEELSRSRDKWMSECANRRFNIDDEAAIKKANK